MHSETPNERSAGVSPAASSLSGAPVRPGTEVVIMGNRARKAKRAGRARLHRIRKDHAAHGDDRKLAAALALATSEHPERSLTPSNWEQVIERKVQLWRTTYRKLSPSAMSRWYKRAQQLRIEDRVTINNVTVSLAQIAKAIKIVEGPAGDDRERLAQLAMIASDIRGEVWHQRID